MSQIGYYNYYNNPHRYSPTEVVDRYQEMLDRATGDEIYANNEDPYSDRNKALHYLHISHHRLPGLPFPDICPPLLLENICGDYYNNCNIQSVALFHLHFTFCQKHLSLYLISTKFLLLQIPVAPIDYLLHQLTIKSPLL